MANTFIVKNLTATESLTRSQQLALVREQEAQEKQARAQVQAREAVEERALDQEQAFFQLQQAVMLAEIAAQPMQAAEQVQQQQIQEQEQIQEQPPQEQIVELLGNLANLDVPISEDEQQFFDSVAEKFPFDLSLKDEKSAEAALPEKFSWDISPSSSSFWAPVRADTDVLSNGEMPDLDESFFASKLSLK